MTTDNERIISETSSIKNVKGRTRLKLLGAMVLLCLLAVVAGSVSTYLSLRGTAEDGTELAQQLQAACALPGTPDPQLAPFCPRADKVVDDAPDVVKKDPPPGPPGDAGPAGEQGPAGEDAPPLTETQVLSALRLFCTNTGKCRGADGADATATQVAIAVSSYCNSRGECQGPAGANGRNGSDGADGQDGVDGQPVTQSQIIAAVNDYCSANNGCRGPAGPAGSDGQNGGQGPAGPAGTANINDACDPAPEGQKIVNVDYTYDPETLSGSITCTYAEDQTGILPPAPQENP